MRFALILVAALILSGCRDRPRPLPATKVEIVKVEVPVFTACVRKSDIPTETPMVGGQLTGNADHDEPLIAASAIRLRAALRQALALLQGCAG